MYRSTLDHALFAQHPAEYLKVWLYLLLRAAAKPRTWWNGQSEIAIPAGGFVGSINTISERCGVSRGQVERALRTFAKCGMIETQVGHKHTLYVIVNFGSYQTGETQEVSGPRRKQDASETQAGCKRDANEIKQEVRSKKQEVRCGAEAQHRPAPTSPLTAAEWDQPDPTEVATRLVDAIIGAHPHPGRRQSAIAAAAQKLVGAVDMEAVAAAAMRNHAAWCEYWKRQPKNAFRPLLERWFADGDYMTEPKQQRGDDEW